MKDQSRFGAVLYVKDVSRVVAFYSAVLDLPAIDRDENHVVLQSGGLQLVVLGIPKNMASSIEIATPPARRANAAFKPVFFVRSLTEVRAAAEAFGGVLNPTDKEWSFRGSRVCDGLDPEGNVVQFREVDANGAGC
jgi:catechol 2,3-dioxygenase-like lactoylglutathione lyase family enzyme